MSSRMESQLKKDVHRAGLFMLLLVLFVSASRVSADFSSCTSPSQQNLMTASYSLDRSRIPVPGQFTASLDVQLDMTIDEDVRAELEVKRRVFFWQVTVPCVGTGGLRIGSCTYNNLCSMMSNSGLTCNGVQCACPLPPGAYSFPNIAISTANLHPIILRVSSNTLFTVKLRFYKKSTNQLLSCIQTELRTQ